MKKFVFFMTLATFPFITETAVDAQYSVGAQDSVTWMEGDLLFQQVECGPLCDAIEEVTEGVNGAKFSHVGMVFKQHDSLMVIEAISKGVSMTPLAVFLARSLDKQGLPRVVTGRLRPEYQNLIKPAISEALRYIGKPYDNSFDMDNDAYYCSEIIYLAFRKANHNKPFFQLQPMTYKSPSSGVIFPVWQEYFKTLGKPVPEGKPGINPGGISRSSYLYIMYPYGYQNDNK